MCFDDLNILAIPSDLLSFGANIGGYDVEDLGNPLYEKLIDVEQNEQKQSTDEDAVQYGHRETSIRPRGIEHRPKRDTIRMPYDGGGQRINDHNRVAGSNTAYILAAPNVPSSSFLLESCEACLRTYIPVFGPLMRSGYRMPTRVDVSTGFHPTYLTLRW